jgi:TATA-box binding protein (TBP) (component of TFIID and TFIIIB)
MEIAPFESYKVSTKTFIVYTNLVLKIEAIFYESVLPITPFVVVKKRRGRKKKIQEEDPNKNITEGSIIRIKYMNDHHGVVLKAKPSTGYFRNSMTVDMIIDDKRLNFKVTRNGKFQITGCKNDSQAEKAVTFFWQYIQPFNHVYELRDDDHLRVYYDPVMYNIDFSLGFQVNRENLDIFINMQTPYTSLLETTFGYTGVNIKLPVTTPFKNLKIKCKEYKAGGATKTSYIGYDSFLEKHMPGESIETKYNTFLVFQSGKIIMSGKAAVLMESAYYEFLNVINKCIPVIREVIC